MTNALKKRWESVIYSFQHDRQDWIKYGGLAMVTLLPMINETQTIMENDMFSKAAWLMMVGVGLLNVWEDPQRSSTQSSAWNFWGRQVVFASAFWTLALCVVPVTSLHSEGLKAITLGFVVAGIRTAYREWKGRKQPSHPIQ